MLPRRPFIGVLVEDGLVVDVWPGAPGARAGLAVGDRVASVDGEPLAGQLVPKGAHAGSVITLAIAGKGNVEVELDPWPSEVTPGSTTTYGHVDVRGARLRTIFTCPDAGAEVAVVLLPGLVNVSLDHAPAAGDAWRRIVVGLAAAGIASLRVERRGVGDSEGEDIDFATELEGYVAGAQTIESRFDVALFGHSVGGMQAPLVAARVPVRHIAVFGTTTKRWSENMVPMARRQLRRRGIAEPDLTRDASLAAAIANETPADINEVHGRPLAYLRQLDRAAIADTWSAFGGNAHILHGEHDIVTDEADHKELAELLRKRSAGAVRTRTLAGLGHTMLAVSDPVADLERPHDGAPSDAVSQAVAEMFSPGFWSM